MVRAKCWANGRHPKMVRQFVFAFSLCEKKKKSVAVVKKSSLQFGLSNVRPNRTSKKWSRTWSEAKGRYQPTFKKMVKKNRRQKWSKLGQNLVASRLKENGQKLVAQYVGCSLASLSKSGRLHVFRLRCVCSKMFVVFRCPQKKNDRRVAVCICGLRPRLSVSLSVSLCICLSPRRHTHPRKKKLASRHGEEKENTLFAATMQSGNILAQKILATMSGGQETTRQHPDRWCNDVWAQCGASNEGDSISSAKNQRSRQRAARGADLADDHGHETEVRNVKVHQQLEAQGVREI